MNLRCCLVRGNDRPSYTIRNTCIKSIVQSWFLFIMYSAFLYRLRILLNWFVFLTDDWGDWVILFYYLAKIDHWWWLTLFVEFAKCLSLKCDLIYTNRSLNILCWISTRVLKWWNWCIVKLWWMLNWFIIYIPKQLRWHWVLESLQSFVRNANTSWYCWWYDIFTGVVLYEVRNMKYSIKLLTFVLSMQILVSRWHLIHFNVLTTFPYGAHQMVLVHETTMNWLWHRHIFLNRCVINHLGHGSTFLSYNISRLTALWNRLVIRRAKDLCV